MSTKHIQAAEFRRLAALQPKDSDIEVALTNAAMQWEIDAKRFEQSQALQDIGKDAFSCIAEMVAALECDYDKLAELRDERQVTVENGEPGHPEHLLSELEVWDRDNGEELKELEAAAGDCKSREDAEQRIAEDRLSIQMRGDWYGYGTEPADAAKPVEFVILLSTGGPAVRIRGELQNGEPCRAWLETQDWFQPWTQYIGADQETLLTYCRCFYFGEG